MRILVTGVMGFIGSHFARLLINTTDHSVIGFSRDSDQLNKRRIDDIKDNPRFHLICGDLVGDISGLTERIDIVVNFAAKTFVDHSIKHPDVFVRNNILGTHNLLEDARRYKTSLFIQVSTDEVYGAILQGVHKENSPLNPRNPYSASKAAADMLALSYHNTYGLPVIITRTENNYGSFQHPQKVLPVFTNVALSGKPLPVYGDGFHKRMWLHVRDHCKAILLLIEKGSVGEIYHVGGSEELTNIQLAETVLDSLQLPTDRIQYIDDRKIRPGHDRRYAIDSSKIRKLGWEPEVPACFGVRKVVEWYAKNQWWFL